GSYNRLQQDILEPFERALKLQTVSSKIHQTTTLLRSSLIYVHMISQLQMMPLETDSTDDAALACGLKIAALHSQLKINIAANPNLATLQLIKSCENNVVSPNRQELLRYLSTNLTRDCLNNLKMENNPKRIVTLIKALYTLSPVDLFDTIDKVLSSKIQTTAQVLSKTITSIRNFNLSLDDAMENRNSILTLQNLMAACAIEGNTNTLRNYLSQRKFSSLIDQFWSKVTNSFKRDFEMSYNRGGPVGKSLQSNSNLIYEAISKCFGENDPSNELQGELQYILKAVSILDT
uniref:Cog5 n=1 Tax=Kluyveromyces lactis TaxID=28985 RepID=UPI00051FF434|nr:Chain B, Cog5 [Kluyveromyces lactis]4U6U_D Chain D, Cog5 [Kluyveromyces lactis]